MPTHTDRAARIAALALLAAGIGVVVIYRGRLDAEALQDWMEAVGTAGPLTFIAAYAVATVLFVPGSLLTLAGGALFGPVAGTLYSLTGATIGATAAFLLARYLAADWATRRIGGRLGRLTDGVAHEGWRFVAFVRLVPLFPFNALNYALGLTRIRLSHFVAASFLCMLPGAAAYTYLGYAGREALAGAEGLIQKGLLALGLLAVIAFLPRLVARIRQRPPLTVTELARRLAEASPPLVLDVRGEAEFEGELGHIRGAVNVPVDELEARIGEIDSHAERPVAIVCRTERRSLQAA
ncbi:MAG: sulfurtransferase [Gammaproteobacteria bacterium]|nr:sulfurtransferase [Gammaproteobacteria bacterium]